MRELPEVEEWYEEERKALDEELRARIASNDQKAREWHRKELAKLIRKYERASHRAELIEKRAARIKKAKSLLREKITDIKKAIDKARLKALKLLKKKLFDIKYWFLMKR